MHLPQVFLLAIASSARLASAATDQSLANALGGYPDLSSFQRILSDFPGLIANTKAATGRESTVLVPTNDAVSTFAKQNNVTDVTQLPLEKLQRIFQYHTLDSGLTATNFSSPKGLTVPTKLTDALYNQRSPGPAILSQFGSEANGQVLYISPDNINLAKFRVRQQPAGEKSNLRAGLGQIAELTGLDGQWQGGYFQAIDTVLEPPGVCSTTIKKLSNSLQSLGDALSKVSLWQQLDKTPNITCLGPDTEAFESAGNPERTLGESELTSALLNFLTDGQTFTSLSNLTVTVTVKDNDIWFNNAKVISPNVLTNNGLIHVLDRVMVADGKPEDSDSDSPSASSIAAAAPTSAAASPSPTGTPPNAGIPVNGNLRAAAVVAFAAGIVLI